MFNEILYLWLSTLYCFLRSDMSSAPLEARKAAALKIVQMTDVHIEPEYEEVREGQTT